MCLCFHYNCQTLFFSLFTPNWPVFFTGTILIVSKMYTGRRLLTLCLVSFFVVSPFPETLKISINLFLSF